MATKSAPGVSRMTAMNSEDRNAKVHENLRRAEELHASKTQKSDVNFKEARITSCSGVLMKNGHAVCLAFPNESPKPIDPTVFKSGETTSMAQ